MKTAKTINEKRRRYNKSQFQFFLLFSYTSFMQLCNKEKSEFKRKKISFLGETFLNGNEERSPKNNQLKRKVTDE